MSCDLSKATEGLKNELWCRWSDGKVGEWADLIAYSNDKEKIENKSVRSNKNIWTVHNT